MDQREESDGRRVKLTEQKEERYVKSFVGGRETQDYDNFVRGLFSPNQGVPGLVKKTFAERHVSFEDQLNGLPHSLQLRAENVADSILEQKRNERLARVPMPTAFDSRNPRYYRSRDFMGLGDWDDALFDYDKQKKEREHKAPLIMNYKNSSCATGSAYLQPVYDKLNVNDSRIIGSNFVMVNTRRYDPLFDKIDRTLKQARTVNSWSA